MDTLELHVWGPAFGLPSIDAECIAAIGYLHTALPSSEWRLVPSNDPAVHSSNRLPALNANGVWSTGYASIVSHLRSLSPHSPSWDLDLDSRLTPRERADALALAALVESRLAPLLDAYLLADHDNWSAATRPALSGLLGFPLSWTVPVVIRRHAVARSAHLGLDGLADDQDDDDDVKAGSSSQGTLDRAMKHLPVSGKKTVTEEMRARTARGIRLHAVVVDALAPLEEQRSRGENRRGKKLRFFDGEVPTSLDCLVLGHLALAQAVELPKGQDWLRAVLKANFPRLDAAVADLRDACLVSPGPLPWTTAPASAMRTAARVLDQVVQLTPNLGDVYLAEWRHRAEKKAAGVSDRGRTLALAGGVLAAGAAVAYGAWTYRGLPPWGARTQTWMAEKRGLGRFGELGAMLDFSFGLADAPMASPSAGWGGGVGLDAGTEHRVVESELSVD